MQRPTTSSVFLFFLLIAALAGCNEERTSVGPDDRWNREIAAPKDKTDFERHPATIDGESSSMAPAGAPIGPTAGESPQSPVTRRR
ncbi:MAG: hypothetical protein HYR85_05690 [Planctomycetes bacterium]|nr:hypothetical protein [Planctomycetota bacterium]MBI3843658.1 hypothetical protein [Planctomycetota bacterium]